VPPETGSLDELIADARMMPLAMLPQPRTEDGVRRRCVDLTRPEIVIPDETASLVDGFTPYGA
jgi:hypothetical protein